MSHQKVCKLFVMFVLLKVDLIKGYIQIQLIRTSRFRRLIGMNPANLELQQTLDIENSRYDEIACY